MAIEWTEHGILCREYYPETDSYDDAQLKIINHGLYITDNNWETARASIGKFTLWNPVTQQDEEVYGVKADIVSTHLLLGDEVYIANEGNTFRIDEDGLSVSNDVNSVYINPDATYILDVTKTDDDSTLTHLMYLDEDGDLNISGSITASSGYIGGTSGWKIITNAIYNGTSSMTSTTSGTYIGTDGIRQYASSSAYVNIQSGVVTAVGASISGVLTATSGTIGGWTINDSYGIYTNSKTSATSTNSGMLIQKSGAIYAGAYNSSTGACPFQVTSAGALTSTSGKLGGWTIGTSAIYNGTTSMTSTTSGTYIGTDGIRQYASSSAYVDIQNGTLEANNVAITGGYIDIESSSTTDSRIILRYNGYWSSMGPNIFFASDNKDLYNAELNSHGFSVYFNGQQNAIGYWQSQGSDRGISGVTDTKPMLDFVMYQQNNANNYPGLEMYTHYDDGGCLLLYPPGNGTFATACIYGVNGAVYLYDNSNNLTIWAEGSQGVVSCVSLQQTSDRNAKRNIQNLNKTKSAEFILNQVPVSFSYEDFNSGIHHGLVAQDVEKIAYLIYGDNDWSIVNTPDGESNIKSRYKSLSYNEFIPDIIATLQVINERLTKLENQLGE